MDAPPICSTSVACPPLPDIYFEMWVCVELDWEWWVALKVQHEMKPMCSFKLSCGVRSPSFEPNSDELREL